MEKNLETWIHETGQERKNSNSGAKTKYMCINPNTLKWSDEVVESGGKGGAILLAQQSRATLESLKRGEKCKSRVWFRDRVHRGEDSMLDVLEIKFERPVSDDELDGGGGLAAASTEEKRLRVFSLQE